ncbi:MAG: J domain-containing protein [Polyangiaceae bacterium]
MVSFREVLDEAMRERTRTKQAGRAATRFPHPCGHTQSVYRDIQDGWRHQQRREATARPTPEGATVAGCFRVLGLRGPCTVADIKRAFRRCARELHPDTPTGSHAAFVALGRAYAQALAAAH